jgi:preprotein translocase subunit SecG
MVILVTIIHIIVSIGLILVVLLQTGKGAEIGAVFGGSSSTIFGSSGAGNFLTRLTTGMAVVFMITSLTLGYFASRKPAGTIFDSRSPVVDQRQPSQANPPSEEKNERATGTQAPAPQSTQPQKSTNP